jgi:hypothetical protein
LHLFNEIWNEGRTPEEWNTAETINIHKKGNKTECGNYRGISLLVTAYKLYSAILKKEDTTSSRNHIKLRTMRFSEEKIVRRCHIYTKTNTTEKKRVQFTYIPNTFRL